MLVDVLSLRNYQSYNVLLAQKIGLNASIYLSVLLDLYQKASETETIVADDYFWVDREYVKLRTTFTVEEQLKLEETLISMGFVFLSDDKKYVRLELNTITGIATTLNEDVIACFDTVRKQSSRVDKKRGQLIAVGRLIRADYPGNLKEALREWLKTISDKYGYVNKQMLEKAQEKLDPIVFSDLTRALDIVQIATVQAYRDMTWALTRYDELHKNDTVKTNVQITNTQSLSNDYF